MATLTVPLRRVLRRPYLSDPILTAMFAICGLLALFALLPPSLPRWSPTSIDPVKANANYTEAIRLDPNSAIAFTNRARTWNATGEFANAIADALSPLGIDIVELPVTPERLFRLIHQAGSPASSTKEDS